MKTPATDTESLLHDLRTAALAALREREARAERASWRVTLRRLVDALAGASEPVPAFQSRRRRLSPEQQLGVFRRDGYLCRYCGTPCVNPAALRALAVISPRTLPYHPHWKRSRSHPLFGEVAATADHVVPVHRGGALTNAANLVTACSRCNEVKGGWLVEELRWILRPPEPGGWDGLESLFLEIFRPEMEDLVEWHEAILVAAAKV